MHRKFPENIECLKFLVKLSSDMGLKEAGEYAMELKKAERCVSCVLYYCVYVIKYRQIESR